VELNHFNCIAVDYDMRLMGQFVKSEACLTGRGNCLFSLAFDKETPDAGNQETNV
jgi:hypothetical protein